MLRWFAFGLGATLGVLALCEGTVLVCNRILR